MAGEKRTIYIAGPIANTTDFVYRFGVARGELKLLGYQPVCPIELNGVDENSRKEDAENRLTYLRNDIAALINCDGIYLLRGWENSRGARLEKLIADGLALIILYQGEDNGREATSTGVHTT